MSNQKPAAKRRKYPEIKPARVTPQEAEATARIMNRLMGRDVPLKPASSEIVVSQNIVSENIVRKTILESAAPLVDPNNGYYPTFNDISDRLIPTLGLDAFEQTVLLRLYRLSRGWRRQTCVVGYGALVKACNISRSQAQRAIASLIEKGLVVSDGRARGTTGTNYVVLPSVPAIPSQNIVSENIFPQGGNMVSQNTVKDETIFPQNTNKHTEEKQTKEHTQKGARVRSRFTLQECERYAASLIDKGIKNPAGLARKIHRDGESDDAIAAFLAPSEPSVRIDASACPDCRGTGFYEPAGAGKGVAKCKHNRLPV